MSHLLLGPGHWGLYGIVEKIFLYSPKYTTVL